MLVLIAVLIALVPAVAIAYPFVRRLGRDEIPAYEDSTGTELELRWDGAVAGLKGAELDWTIGRLAEEDYRWLRRQYMTEAALVLKAMELEEDREAEMLASIEREMESERVGIAGADAEGPPRTCPNCSLALVTQASACPECGSSVMLETLEPSLAPDAIANADDE